MQPKEMRTHSMRAHDQQLSGELSAQRSARSARSVMMRAHRLQHTLRTQIWRLNRHLVQGWAQAVIAYADVFIILL